MRSLREKPSPPDRYLWASPPSPSKRRKESDCPIWEWFKGDWNRFTKPLMTFFNHLVKSWFIMTYDLWLLTVIISCHVFFCHFGRKNSARQAMCKKIRHLASQRDACLREARRFGWEICWDMRRFWFFGWQKLLLNRNKNKKYIYTLMLKRCFTCSFRVPCYNFGSVKRWWLRPSSW